MNSKNTYAVACKMSSDDRDRLLEKFISNSKAIELFDYDSMLLTLSTLMDSVEGDEEELKFDADETIFVAVGTAVEQSESALFWTVQNFSGKRICLLHVHQSTHDFSSTSEELSSSKLKEHVEKALRELERQKLHELLNQYLLVLSQAGVQAEKVWIEKENVEIGIVEIITRHNIKWLVMSSSAKTYPLEQAWLNSKKASFVCRQAPTSCHVWVVCSGRLLYTRGSSADRFEKKNPTPLLLLNSEIGNESEYPETDTADSVEDEIQCDYDSNLRSTWLNNSEVGTSKPILLKDGERGKGKDKVLPVQEIQDLLEQAVMDVNNSKQKEFEEVLMRWKEEDTTMEAKFKAKALESLCVQEMSKREEIREMLEREKQEVQRVISKHCNLKKEFCTIQDQKSLLESKFENNQRNVKELEEKIITAVKLLISFKEQRDSLRTEYEFAVKELLQVKNLEEKKPPILCRAEMPTFSFMEINGATREFDPSRKISEGRYGSVYKGNLRHMDVAIKMLPSYGSRNQLDFQYEVEALSRVRHPNLVTIIGACSESHSLVYEYLRKGSLEDRLACKNNIAPLPWELRVHIAMELCSVLIFLHHNKPIIVHGNLKASKILLDDYFVCKLGGLGIFRLTSQEKNVQNPSSLFHMGKETSVYFDPEYLETGKLSPESDVYSFGIILLRILTGKSFFNVIGKVKHALETDNIGTVLDSSAGDWPPDLAQQMAILAIQCCEKERLNRPDLVSEVWTTLEPMKCIASESFLDSMKQNRVPSHFVCPIFQEVMANPLIAADGFTYEAKSIKEWFESGHSTSPMTNLKLEHCNLVPNYALQNAIQEWQQLS